MLTLKGNASVIPILHVGKLWLRQINMPRKAEAEPEATSVGLQRQSLDTLSGRGEDRPEPCQSGNTTRDPSWSEKSL